ncbi:MAG: DUF3667 domain-containing protein [Betaproteobacteria bacterium]
MTNLAPEREGTDLRVPALLADTRCRNCSSPAPGAFCPQCGQETSVALPTARQFLKDAAGRYVALDGRLWRTLAALLLHPGRLTREYFSGRRRRYGRPARLFLLLSIAMFALLRIVVDVPSLTVADLVTIDPQDTEAAVPPPRIAEGSQAAAAASRPAGPSLTLDKDANVVVVGPPGVVTDLVRHRVDRFNAMSRQDKVEQITFGTVRYGPYAMVVLLPVFALLLKLLYLGRARRHPLRPRLYSEHLVFAAHDLSFLFLIVMIAVVVPWGVARAALALWAVVYSLRAMKVVYGGRWTGVVARAWFLAVSYLVLFSFVVAGLVLAAVLLR